MKEPIDILEMGFKELNIDIDKNVIDNLISYKDILLEWNKNVNLTSITEEKEVYIKHFLDSATCISTGYIKENSKVIDIGTGAGFPGVVLKILNNNIDLTLLDSLKKRTLYLEHLALKLGLEGVNIIHGRAEDFARKFEHREMYDIALSRAVASLNVLLEYCLPYIKVGGFFLCQKGPNYKKELSEADKALGILGGKIREIKEYDFSEINMKRYIIIVEKIVKTPAKYPRKAGKPSNNPLK